MPETPLALDKGAPNTTFSKVLRLCLPLHPIDMIWKLLLRPELFPKGKEEFDLNVVGQDGRIKGPCSRDDLFARKFKIVKYVPVCENQR